MQAVVGELTVQGTDITLVLKVGVRSSGKPRSLPGLVLMLFGLPGAMLLKSLLPVFRLTLSLLPVKTWPLIR